VRNEDGSPKVDGPMAWYVRSWGWAYDKEAQCWRAPGEMVCEPAGVPGAAKSFTVQRRTERRMMADRHQSRRRNGGNLGQQCSRPRPGSPGVARTSSKHVPGRRPRRLRAAVGSSGRRAHDAAITVAQMRNVLGRVKVYIGMTGRIPPSLRRQGGTACSFRRRRSSTALLGRPRQSEAGPGRSSKSFAIISPCCSANAISGTQRGGAHEHRSKRRAQAGRCSGAVRRDDVRTGISKQSRVATALIAILPSGRRRTDWFDVARRRSTSAHGLG
jgi:hypothetical protein